MEHDFYFSIFFHILAISESQLTFIFFRGVETTNQITYMDLYIYIWILLSHFIVNPWVNAWLNITYIRIILSHFMFSTHGKTYHGLTSQIFVSKKSQVPIDLAPFWWMAFQLVMSYVNWSYVQIIYPQLTMVDKQGMFNVKIKGLCWYTGIVSLRLTRMMYSQTWQ